MIELWGTFLSFLGTAAAIRSILSFHGSFFARRWLGKKYYAGVLCLYILSMTLVMSVSPESGLGRILDIILSFTFCMLLHQCRWDRCFFVVFTVYIIFVSLSYWRDQFCMAIFDLSYEEYVWNIPLYSISFLSGVFLLLFLSAIVKRLHKPFTASGRPLVWIPLFVVFPLLTLPVMLIAGVPAAEQSIWQICLAILDLVDVTALFLLDYLERAALEREQLIAVQERARVQDENIGALSQAYGAQRKMTHDFRAHLDTLSGMVEEGDVQALRTYLAELRERHTERVLLVNSHHAAADAVLNQKGYLGMRQGVDMRFRVNDLSPLHIPATDLTIVLGNLLDNAIEACALFEEGERWVELQAFYEQEDEVPMLSLSVKNPSRPVKIQDGKIETSKKDALLHGFGLQNVGDILHRYGAEHTLTYKNGEFLFCCDWPDLV